MNNLPLWRDMDRPHVAGSDTSRAAADSIGDDELGKLQREVLSIIGCAEPFGLTDDGIQACLDMIGNTQRPRRRELQLKGLICDSGRKRATRSGRLAVVWIIKEPNDDA